MAPCAACGSMTVGMVCALCHADFRKRQMERARQAMAQQQLMQNSFQPYLGNLGAGSIQPMPFTLVGAYHGVMANTLGAGASTPREPLPSAGMKVEDLIGWRIWRVRNGHLWSYSADYAWMPGEVSEGDPGDHDGAGIWAFKDKRRAFQKAVESGGSYVWGSVLLWGHVVEHKDGYRASKARIVSIGGATRDVTREVLADLCEIHGVAVPTHVSRPAIADTPPIEYGDRPRLRGRPRGVVVSAHPIEPPESIVSGLAFIIGGMVCFTFVTALLAWLLRS